MLARLILISLAAASLYAQDEVRVSSPSGRVQVTVGVANAPVAGGLAGLAYQVDYNGKELIDTSFMGFGIHNQTPLLGEKVGLIASSKSSGDRYNSAVAEYMQNGSLGRQIHVEVRAYDNGVAFRYLIPKSAPLEQMQIESEITEFRFTAPLGFATDAGVALPFAKEVPGVGWVGIASSKAPAYAPTSLVSISDRALVTKLAPLADNPLFAFLTATPWTSPWRVIEVATSREALLEWDIIRRLP